MDTRTTRNKAEGIAGVKTLKELERNGLAVVTSDAARLAADFTAVLRLVADSEPDDLIPDLLECARKAAIYGLLR